jgi:outer membrane protein assembly factor BamA
MARIIAHGEQGVRDNMVIDPLPGRGAKHCLYTWMWLAAAAALWAGGPAAWAAEENPAEAAASAPVVAKASSADGPAYAVSRFVLVYQSSHPQHPLVEELEQLPVTLVKTDTGYIAPQPGQPTVTEHIADLAGSPQLFHGSAIRAVATAIVAEMNHRGISGVYVRPDATQLDETGKDVRPKGDTSLKLVIYTGVVKTMRTLGSGDRVPVENGVDNPKHEPIKRRSPVQSGELLSKQELDNYTYWLNRHPGRRVDVAVAQADRQGGIDVDFLVNENKPWSVFAQVSNTGTKSTNEWRERFGFFDVQTTDNDDIFSIDYTTAGFERTNAVVISYDAPFFDYQRLRWRVQGLWSEYSASDIGQISATFRGHEWQVGGDLTFNVFQFGNAFVDIFAGAKWRDVEVRNIGVDAGEDFIIPHAGISFERFTDTVSTSASVDFEWNHTSASDSDIAALGRTGVDQSFLVVQWQATHSFYLEPIFNREKWENINNPQDATLAHELWFSFRGQTSFGERVIAQSEGVAGGLYTVRGYDESIAAGDTLLVFSAEYRFHLPRVFEIDPDPWKHQIFGRPFRVARQEVYSRPDWDLILRGFVDVGHVIVEDPVASIGEKNQTLVGTGVGVELQVLRNLTVRCDYGIALEDAGPDKAGNQRIHFVATILY